MTTINGIPAHILLVHAVVVLVPLAALLAILAAAWPRARRRIGIVLPVLTALCVVLIPITTQAGEWLEHHVERSALVRAHTELGDQLLVWVIGLFLTTALFWGLEHTERFESSAPGVVAIARRPAVRVVISVLMVALAVVSIVQVVRIGDSGAKAVWTGEVSG